MAEQPTIAEMNLTIAYFMGMQGTPQFIVSNYRYDLCWELLMVVWYNFVDLRFDKPMDQMKHSEFKTTVGYAILYGCIELAHKNIYEAIQWYNTQTHNNG